MSSIADYLAKQLFIEKTVVTYRSLSRHCKVHVNTAKNELATYHGSPQVSSERSYATYILSGEPLERRNNILVPTHESQNNANIDVDPSYNEGDVNDEPEPEMTDSDIVPQLKFTLVGEKDLESAKAQYARIHCEHVYCLSPAPLVDAELVREPAAQVYKADAKTSTDAALLLGRVIGSDVQKGKVPPIGAAASSGREIPTRPSRKVEQTGTARPKEDLKDGKLKMETEESKPKASNSSTNTSGKLDWSKAKSKANKEQAKVKEETKKRKMKEEGEGEEVTPKAQELEKKLPTGAGNDSQKTEFKTKGKANAREVVKPSSSSSAGSISDAPKRGTKRKSVLPTFSDEEESEQQSSRAISPAANGKTKAKKAVIISEDEDEDEDEEVVVPKARSSNKVSAKARAKGLKVESETLRSLRAMMDIDDDEVVRASRAEPTPPPASSDNDQSEVQDEDIDMNDDEPIKPMPKKKKEKKVIPIGRNGLKKKRVVKSRMKVDDKGYMVTEDYSEYESVDEEEPEEEVKPKGKKSTAKVTKPSAKDSSEDTKASKKEKPANKLSNPRARKPSTGSSKSRTGSLMSFFERK